MFVKKEREWANIAVEKLKKVKLVEEIWREDLWQSLLLFLWLL